ncbi:MAG: 2Fe-2S iron-sulfur cluster-binding protein [Gammaproteobacteria bacterium]|nr:2Fe-2S iron-sulfur cluster-binding protein [Gammaproteobacteria bacterium]
MKQHKIVFTDTPFETVELPEGPFLADYLTAKNSPVLFGCRSGICGTCLIEVTPLEGDLPSPENLEAETLTLCAPSNLKARLACQLNLTTSISLKKIKSL